MQVWTMNGDEDRGRRFEQLPLALKPEGQLELEMIVLDQDSAEAGEFLAGQGIEIGKGADPLAVCSEWLKLLQKAEQKKHNIRYDDKGPTLGLSRRPMIPGLPMQVCRGLCLAATTSLAKRFCEDCASALVRNGSAAERALLCVGWRV